MVGSTILEPVAFIEIQTNNQHAWHSDDRIHSFLARSRILLLLSSRFFPIHSETKQFYAWQMHARKQKAKSKEHARENDTVKKARYVEATPPTPSPEEEETITLQSLLGHDPSLLKKVQDCSGSEDDPPLVFAWHPDAVGRYHQSASTAPGLLPPLPANLFPAGLPADLDGFQRGILDYLVHGVPGAERIENTAIAATLVGFANAAVKLLGLANTQYFQDLHAHVAANNAVTADNPGHFLARVWTPRPRDSRGRLDRAVAHAGIPRVFD